MDTLVDNIVLTITNSMLYCSILYPDVYEKINVCQPLNLPKVFSALKTFSGQNVKNGFGSP